MANMMANAADSRHFFVLDTHAEQESAGGIQVEADDDDEPAHARSLDTYTLLIPDGP
jgi:hypothetical protein